MSTRRRPHWPAFGLPDPVAEPEDYELACDMRAEYADD